MRFKQIKGKFEAWKQNRFYFFIKNGFELELKSKTRKGASIRRNDVMQKFLIKILDSTCVEF